MKLEAGGKVGAIAGFIRGTAAVGEASHLTTLRAGTLGVGVLWLGGVAAIRADEPLLRFAKHGPKLAALHTIRATDNLIRHSYSFSFPPRLGHRVERGRRRPLVDSQGGAERNYELVLI